MDVIPELSPHLFWDVDPQGVDPELHAAWLARRVLEYGRWQDWGKLVDYYGKPRLAQIVTTLRALDPKAFSFCRAWFDLPASAFRIIDFLRHAYPLLAPPETVDGVRLHSLDDVTAMKLNAIVNRGAKKDFYDIHALLQQRPLPDLVSCFARKYADSEPFMLVRSLTYFDDAELDPDPVSLVGQDWPAVKSGILAAVRSLPA